MATWKYEISILVFNSISHSFTTLTCEISGLTLKEKFYILAHHNLLFMIYEVMFTEALTFPSLLRRVVSVCSFIPF